MKKFIYLLMTLAVALVSCENSLEDVYNDLDSVPTEGIDFIKANESYTFTSDDYETYEMELDGEEFFKSQDQADLLIPDFLSDKFPVFGGDSFVNVTYNLFDETVLESVSTTETLSNINNIDAFLSEEMESVDNGTFVELTYNAEVLSYTLSDTDFEAIGAALSSKYPEATSSAARFGNFERRDSRDAFWSDDMITEALTFLLAKEYSTGQVVVITFAIFDGRPGSESFTLQNNGFSLLKLDIEASGIDAIEYELTDEDYTSIATDLSATYPEPAENLGRFGSFDTREEGTTSWTIDMIIEGLNTVLPVAMEGDIYAVSYEVFNGSRGTDITTLIYTSGVYVANANVVEVSVIIAKNNGRWEFPYTITKPDYDSFGFGFPNFNSSSIYILDIFLEDLYPFAQAGDVAPVSYVFRARGENSTKYGKSVFDGDKWTLTPDVIETSFQYGFEDGIWVPDNTINYTLTNADFALVGNGRFNNFDVRSGADDEPVAARVAKINTILLNNFPNDEEGQKYLVSYPIFNGAPGVFTTKVIKVGNAYILNE